MNIRFYSIVFVCALFATSCTKVEMETPLPDTDVLTPESMTSDLDRIDITANPDSVDLMLEKTGLKISVAAQVDYFTASGEVLFQKTGSIEIKGTGSTSKVMKSIGIDFDTKVDNSDGKVLLYSQSGAPFRFFFFDADLAALRPKNPRLPEMEYGEDAMSILFQILFEDDDVFTQLEERQKYWYDRFSPEDFNQLVDEMTEKIESDIPYLIAKWETPGNLMEWNLHVAQLKRDFERTDHFNRKKYQ